MNDELQTACNSEFPLLRKKGSDDTLLACKNWVGVPYKAFLFDVFGSSKISICMAFGHFLAQGLKLKSLWQIADPLSAFYCTVGYFVFLRHLDVEDFSEKVGRCRSKKYFDFFENYWYLLNTSL